MRNHFEKFDKYLNESALVFTDWRSLQQAVEQRLALPAPPMSPVGGKNVEELPTALAFPTVDWLIEWVYLIDLDREQLLVDSYKLRVRFRMPKIRQGSEWDRYWEPQQSVDDGGDTGGRSASDAVPPPEATAADGVVAAGGTTHDRSSGSGTTSGEKEAGGVATTAYEAKPDGVDVVATETHHVASTLEDGARLHNKQRPEKPQAEDVNAVVPERDDDDRRGQLTVDVSDTHSVILP